MGVTDRLCSQSAAGINVVVACGTVGADRMLGLLFKGVFGVNLQSEEISTLVDF